MSTYQLSEAFKFELADGDTVWPSTVNGSYRIASRGEGHNIFGEGECSSTEQEMISAVLNEGRPSRFRSKTNLDRAKHANHFSIFSPSVKEIYVNVGGVFIKFK